MLDLKLLRTNHNIKIKLEQRGFNFDIDNFMHFDFLNRELQAKIENLQAIRNSKSKEIGLAKSQQKDITLILKEVEGLSDDIKSKIQSSQELQKQLQQILVSIPNLHLEDVPVGKDENDNKEIYIKGTIPKFNFKILDHVDFAIKKGWLEPERATDIAASRFMVLSGDGAKLYRAISQHMLDIHTLEHGYIEKYVPYLVNGSTLYGTGQLPKFEQDLFQITKHKEHEYIITDSDKEQRESYNNQLYLIPTAEVPLTNLVKNQIIDANDLPLKFVAYTPCFRSEAGSYGKDTKGLIRQHQFDKVELVHIVAADKSKQALEELTLHAEKILQSLELPYRKVLLCSGDMGFSAAKTYDLEVWLPSQDAYREISSCSNCTNFQARRLKARYKADNNKKEFVHTLNGSALAVGRTFIAIIENYQNKDCQLIIPNALRPYMQGKTTI